MYEYKQSERLREIAEKVIAENEIFAHLRSSECRIAYQTSTQEKKKNGGAVRIYADTMLVPEKLKPYIPYDFVITFYWPNCEMLQNDKLERLMNHELRHVGFDKDGNCRLIPHDVEDFRDNLEAWGFDWLR